MRFFGGSRENSKSKVLRNKYDFIRKIEMFSAVKSQSHHITANFKIVVVARLGSSEGFESFRSPLLREYTAVWWDQT